MKFCAVVAEYNPFHLGHLKQIEYIKKVINPEHIVVIMSGNFTQRGEVALLNKFVRAKHAVLAGADAVIELPTVFATANAETFATGAINVLNSLGCVDGICFGIESGNKDEYLTLANAMLNETAEFKNALKTYLETGVSLAKAKFLAVKEVYGDKFNEQLINSPNNVLGLEYVKAIIKCKSNMEIFPMLREGDHNDLTLKQGITSATSIRNAVKSAENDKVKPCVPEFVFNDLTTYPHDFNKLCLSKLLTTPTDQLKLVADCTEGLENRIKAITKDSHSVDDLVEKVSTKRYPSTRIRRIITANLLGIKEKFVKECLSTPLYAKVLAVKSDCIGVVSTLNKNATIPVLTRKSDLQLLSSTAKDCFEIDVLANDLFNLITNQKTNENYMLMV